MDYLVPTAVETPNWETGKTVTPSPHHPIGAKGVGESATVGAPPAIVNAVVDALWHLGVRHIDIPITVASEKKSQALFEYAREKGHTDEEINLIKSPAGLALGGETMQEIALSVMAEIIQLRHASTEQPGTARQLPLAAEAIDPICGMTVVTTNAKYTSEFEGRTIYFCCLRCKETFDRS
jgi:YHS domain-containing protein